MTLHDPASTLTPAERRASFWLGSLVGLRMLGLFIILPVFGLYAETLAGGYDKAMVGLALGVYGLTQGLLQIPYGWASDRWGRKPLLYIGLTLFAIGSLGAAMATTIQGVIIGRAFQGAGAVSGVVMALTADLTRESVRGKAMAIIGISIGLAFELSLVAGPWLERAVGVPGIFALTGLLALGSLLVVAFALPTPPVLTDARRVQGSAIKRVWAVPELRALNVGVFALHAALTAMFVVVPYRLRDAGVEGMARGWFYLGVTVLALLLIAPLMRHAHKPERVSQFFRAAVIGLLVVEISMAMLGASTSLWLWALALVAFFAAFNLLEIALPTLVSLHAPSDIKGTTLGVFATLQFLGAFVGGAVGGWLAKTAGDAAPFVFCAALAALWWWIDGLYRNSSPPSVAANSR